MNNQEIPSWWAEWYGDKYEEALSQFKANPDKFAGCDLHKEGRMIRRDNIIELICDFFAKFSYASVEELSDQLFNEVYDEQAFPLTFEEFKTWIPNTITSLGYNENVWYCVYQTVKTNLVCFDIMFNVSKQPFVS